MSTTGILPSGAGAPWQTEYAGTHIAGGVKPEEFDYFHELIAVDEMCRCGAAGVSASFVGLSIGKRTTHALDLLASLVLLVN